MKTILLVLILTAINFAQSTSINLAGYDVELGMYSETVWKLLSPIFLVSENEEGNYYVSDKGDKRLGHDNQDKRRCCFQNFVEYIQTVRRKIKNL